MGYSPIIGRFLQRDPRGYVDGANAYSLERSNPLNTLDPFGLQTHPSTQPSGFSIPAGAGASSTSKFNVTLNDGGQGVLSVHVANFNPGQFFESGYFGAEFEETACKKCKYQWQQKVKITISNSATMTPAQLAVAKQSETDEHAGASPFDDFVLDNGTDEQGAGGSKKTVAKSFAGPPGKYDASWFKPGTSPYVGFVDSPSLPVGKGHWGTGAVLKKEYTLELFCDQASTGLKINWSLSGNASNNAVKFGGVAGNTSVSVDGNVEGKSVSPAN